MGWSIGFRIGPLRYRTSLSGKRRKKRSSYKKRSSQRYHYGQLKVDGKVIWQCEHHHQTESAAIQCSERERRRRGMQPAQTAPAKDWHQPPVEGLSPLRQPTTGQAIKAAAANRRAKRAVQAEPQLTAPLQSAQIYPQPAPYVYYRVTSVQLTADRSTLRMDLVSDSGEPWQRIEAPVAQIGPQALEMQPGDRFTWDGQSLGNRVPVRLQAELQQLASKLNAMPAQKRAISRHDIHTVQTLREGGYVFNPDNYVVPVGNR
jgi:hypothetical protein